MEPNAQAASDFNPVQIKRILIALDYDPTAQKVAETGYSLATALNAEVILVHVIGETAYYSSLDYSPIMGFTGFSNTDPALNINVEEVKRASEDFLNKSRLHLGDENIKIFVAEGDFAESILQTAHDFKADMIVLGTVSKRWLEKVIMGSVAEKVLQHSKVPVFIIPTRGNA